MIRWIASLAGLALMTSLGHAELAASSDASSPPLPQHPKATGDLDEPFFDEDVIFEAGTHGYTCFRIPAVVEAADGTILAFAEGRVADCGDHGDIDLVLRRSLDGGRTWGPLEVVIDGAGDTRGNPAPVVDRETGRVVLLSTWNANGDTKDRRPFVSYSDDHGVTWSEPVDITDDVKLPEWEFYATGPVHAIQLQRGPHAGRLVAGANHTWGSDRPEGLARGAHLLYSDDGGQTWNIGAVDSVGDNVVNPQEVSVVELTDGRVYAAARDQHGTAEGTRAFAVSSDGGESFDARFAPIPDLSAPIIQGATLRQRASDAGDDHDRILFSAPAHPASREAMAIRSSYDEGQTWEHWDEGKIIHWGPAAYSDMVSLPDHEIGLMYEAGEGTSPYDEIRFARFNEAYLATPNGDPPNFPDPPEPGPTTPDHSRTAEPVTAYVRGECDQTDGPSRRHGSALSLDGESAHLQIPFTDALDLGSDDFTVSAWFRYDGSETEQVLVWAYGIGSSKPSFWLRAEPGADRLRALITTENGTSSVATDQAYDDGAWHQVALRRADGELSLWVDGDEVASTSAPEGSVTIGREFGIDGLYVGQRMDGIQQFDGDIDEVRVYRRGLTDHELNIMHSTNAPLARDLVLRLPLDEIEFE
ncbi:sialidase family protein [Haloactinopolyspora sp.]|uniref:sialidase family protein n=1 Tax=Haloactinopolyspora sp. TaxID=1966353 RepID=UPI00260D5742|nr:sialidase family protein [Haloactinopolyspora sp.]